MPGKTKAQGRMRRRRVGGMPRRQHVGGEKSLELRRDERHTPIMGQSRWGKQQYRCGIVVAEVIEGGIASITKCGRAVNNLSGVPLESHSPLGVAVSVGCRQDEALFTIVLQQPFLH